MFSGRHPIKTNEEGRVFIDRNGQFFNYILNFLRNGEWILPKDSLQLEMIKREISFFGLPDPFAPSEEKKKPKSISKCFHLFPEFVWNPQRKGSSITLDLENQRVSQNGLTWNQVQTTEPLLVG